MTEKRYTHFLGIDHDGTLTDSSKENQEYREIVTKYNATRLGISENEVTQRLDVAEQEIRRHPGRYGWKKKYGAQEVIVAPAISDHYLLYQEATRLVLDQFLAEEAEAKINRGRLHHVVEEIGGVSQYIETMFQLCSPQLGVHYRSEANSFLRGLIDLVDRYNERQGRGQGEIGWSIVTNSSTQRVSDKLATLKLKTDIPVVGGAKKAEVDSTWTGVVPEGETQFGGFPRGVYLQRPEFYTKLTSQVKGPERTIAFLDDVGEFMLPLVWLIQNDPTFAHSFALLLSSPLTPKWEKEYFLRGHKDRDTVPDLLTALARLEAWLQDVLSA